MSTKPIRITGLADLRKLLGGVKLVGARFTAAKEEILVAAAHAIRDEWVHRAGRSLGSTALAYISAIGEPQLRGSRGKEFVRIPFGGRGKTKLEQRDFALAHMVEFGRAPFDLKPGLLGSPSARVSQKEGRRYVVVPFDHTRPGVNRPTFGRPADAAFRVRGWKGAKLAGIQNAINEVFDVYKAGERVKAGHVPKLKGFQELGGRRVLPHKHDILENAMKMRGLGRGAPMVFRAYRTVTEDSEGWIHPGFRGKKIMFSMRSRAQRILRETAREVAERYAGQIARGGSPYVRVGAAKVARRAGQ